MSCATTRGFIVSTSGDDASIDTSIAMNVTSTEFQVRLEGPSDRWFSWGIGSDMNADVWMVMETDVEDLYTADWDVHTDVQNINDVTVTDNGGRRVATFTRPLTTGDSNDFQMDCSMTSLDLVWARSGSASYSKVYHGNPNRGNLPDIELVDVDDIVPGTVALTETGWWTAYHTHGLLMFLAFSVLFPLAILSTLLRTLIGASKNAFWFQAHRVLNVLAACLAIIAYILVATQDNYSFLHTKHGVLGMIILCWVVVQIIIGITRPHKKKKGRKAWLYGHRLMGFLIIIASAIQINGGVRLDKVTCCEATDFKAGALVFSIIVVLGLAAASFYRTYVKSEESKATKTGVELGTQKDLR